jgi:chromosomal replication initiation ATPase DnaA
VSIAESARVFAQLEILMRYKDELAELERQYIHQHIRGPQPESIVEAVSAVSGVPVSKIYGYSREHYVLPARWVAVKLIYDYVPGMSYPVLGKLFSGRDHCTMLHARRRATQLLEDPDSEVSKLWRAVFDEMNELKAA